MSVFIVLADILDEDMNVELSNSLSLITKSLPYAMKTAREEGVKLIPSEGPRVVTVYKIELDTYLDEGVYGGDMVYRVAYPRNLMHPCQLLRWPDSCDTDDEECKCKCNGRSKEPYGGIVDSDDMEAQAAANGAALDVAAPVDDAPPVTEELSKDHYEQYFHKFMHTHFPSIPKWVDVEGFRSFIWTSIYEEDYMFFKDFQAPELLFPLISNTIGMKSGTRLVPAPSTIDSLFWRTECFRIPEPGPNVRSTFRMFMETHFSNLPEWVKVKEFRSYMWNLYTNLPPPDEDGYVQVPQLFFPLITATINMRSSASLTPPPVDMYSLFWGNAHSNFRVTPPFNSQS